jgi:hypothetical protein
LLGAILAIPLAAMLQLILDAYLLRQKDREPLPAVGRDAIGLLRYQAHELVDDVRRHLRHKPDAVELENDLVEEEVESIALELDRRLSEQAPPSTSNGGAT